MKIVLLILAVTLKIALSPFLVVYNVSRCLQEGWKRAGLKGMYDEFNEWCWELACAVDQLGNVLGRYTWNDVFEAKGGYSAGDRMDTISYFLGANKHRGTLSGTGEKMSGLLDNFEQDHTLKAYENCNERLKNKLMDL